jgi:hypothetical protein
VKQAGTARMRAPSPNSQTLRVINIFSIADPELEKGSKGEAAAAEKLRGVSKRSRLHPRVPL